MGVGTGGDKVYRTIEVMGARISNVALQLDWWFQRHGGGQRMGMKEWLTRAGYRWGKWWWWWC